MARRPCAEPGCPVITDAGRCDKHARGNANARGYDARHQRLRAAWQRRIDAGEPVNCWRCGEQITGTDWDLGHDGPNTYGGPEHRRQCNRSAAGRAAHGLAPR